MLSRLQILFFLQLALFTNPQPLQDSCEIDESLRFDCFPELDATQQACIDRGCCWKPALNDLNTPYCFYGPNSIGYKVCGRNDTDTGFTLDLCLSGKGGPYGNNIGKLKADFRFETDDRLRIKVSIHSNIFLTKK